MVAIIGLVVCQEEEFTFLYKDHPPTGRDSGSAGRHGIHGSHRAMFWRRGVLSTKRKQRHFPDRKSTRLNSSHLGISYAVFCLKKKKKNTSTTQSQTTEGRTSPETVGQWTH